MDKQACRKESRVERLKETLQRSTQEEKEKICVPDLSRSNWVSDLLRICCFPAIRPCVGSTLRTCVCVCNTLQCSAFRIKTG